METEITHPRVALFVSVGTTAIRPELGKTRDDYKQLQRKIADFTTLARDRAAAELPALRAGAVFADVVEAHAWVLRLPQEDLLDNLNTISAEVTSTRFLAANPQSGLGGGLDPGRVRIVLLASDTADGLFCAYVNASLLHEFLVRPACKCGARFDDFVSGPKCPAVHIRVVPGMDARRLETVYPHLQELCGKEAEGSSRVMFNITGGYKGTVPLITWLAGGFFAPRGELFYQHETVLATTRFTFSPSSEGGSYEIKETIEIGKSIWPCHR